MPGIVRLLLEFNGFDTYLALKGIQWDDKKYFFQALEESVLGLAEIDDGDDLKMRFQEELRANNQTIQNFRLKLGHKNLIINLCHELQKTSVEDFNSASYFTVKIPEASRDQMELVVKQKPASKEQVEHRYYRDENIEEHLDVSHDRKRMKLDKTDEKTETVQQLISSDTSDQIQYVYETDDDGTQFLVEQEYLDDDAEIVEYQEISTEDIDHASGILTAEQIVKSEAGTYEQCFDLSDYEHTARSLNRSGEVKNTKKPKHMYTDEFLQTQTGKLSITPGRRRPKIHKFYPDTEAGMIERWQDLVRQSCEVIVPSELLSRFDLSHIEITRIADNIWEVLCPMCSKKLRLQLTKEGKYINFKRSNFERHLRIVHYKQILIFNNKSEDEHSEMIEEHTE